MAVIRNEPDPATTPLGSPEPQFSISPVRPCFRLPEARVGDWGWSLFLFFFFKKSARTPGPTNPRSDGPMGLFFFTVTTPHSSWQRMETGIKMAKGERAPDDRDLASCEVTHCDYRDTRS